MKYSDILKTEYDYDFDIKCQQAMATSFHKYGPVKANYANGNVDAIKELKKRLALFEIDGNTEHRSMVKTSRRIDPPLVSSNFDFNFYFNHSIFF